jgi:ATP-dependent Lon protease
MLWKRTTPDEVRNNLRNSTWSFHCWDWQRQTVRIVNGFTYLEFAASLPWGDQARPPTTNLADVRVVLASEHAGMNVR